MARPQARGVAGDHGLSRCLANGRRGRFEDGTTGSPESYDANPVKREAIVHTPGNPTLLTSGLNISSGNDSFVEKRAKFGTHTGLFLNKWFSDKDKWTEVEIRERLADLAVARWIGFGAL